LLTFLRATDFGTTSGDVFFHPDSGRYTLWSGEDEDAVDVPISPGACSSVPPPQVNNAFLCYSTNQVTPGVWPMDVAQALLKQGGYWSPYAVPGTVAGGTNIGGYHLVCNLGSGQSAGDSTLGGAGETDGPGSKQDVTNVAGHYPILGS